MNKLESEGSSYINPEDATSAIAGDLTLSEGGESGAKGPEPNVNASHESVVALKSYQIRPPLQEKFKATPVKDIIHNVLTDTLSGKSYDSENAKLWTINISNTINKKIKELRMQRYKHIVQVTIGERRGAGVKSGLRCLWDCETDGYASDIFMNESIFSVVVVFAIYLY